MKPVDVYEFIEFGAIVQTIRWFPADTTDGPKAYDIAKYRISQLEYFRDRWLVERKVGIDPLTWAIDDLRGPCLRHESNQFSAMFPGEPSGGSNAFLISPIDWKQSFQSAARHLNELMTILQHECHKFPIVVVSQARAFDTTILMSEAERALSASAQKRLSPHHLEGWREAGKCLAFDVPTAGAFQMLRVTEALIRKYRKLVTNDEGPDSDGLAQHINALKTAGVKESVIGALRSLKNAHRNPTMHPGKNLTPDEAAALFGLCTSVIDFIAADMDSREQAKAAGS